MKFLKDFVIAFLIGVLIFLLLLVRHYLYGQAFPSLQYIFSSFLINQLYSVSLYFINAYYFRIIIGWSSRESVKIKSLFVRAVGAIILTILSIFILNGIVEVLINGNTFSEFIAQQVMKKYYSTIFISAIVIAVFYYIYYNQNKQKLKITEQKIIADTASANFEALKNQLDPHFLFNSLNVLTSLIEENPDLANKFTTSLSKVYRYVLEQKNKNLVSIEEELLFAKEYMSLMLVRFEDSIEFNIPEKLLNPEAKVVPLALQLLLENALKHNQITPEKKLVISIQEKGDYLIVSNNLQPKQILNKSTGLGLQNIRDRYALFSSNPVYIQQEQNKFQVEIPLLDPNLEVALYKGVDAEDKAYLEAKKHISNLRGFYLHLLAYSIFSVVMLYLNLSQSPEYIWAIFPIVGWGIGILSHATSIFQWRWLFTKRWEERKINEYMDKKF